MAFTSVTITFVVLAIAQTTISSGIRRWNDDLVDPDYFDVSDNCLSEACLSMFPKKRDVAFEMEKPRQVLASYHIMGKPWQVSCPCETQYDILDLGLGNYPRYLANARCAPKACFNKFNQCRLVHYKVHVLQQRDTSVDGTSEEQQYVEQVALPESLGLNWQMKPIKIAVACVASDGKKN